MQFKPISETDLAAALRKLALSDHTVNRALSGACAIDIDGDLYAIKGSPAAAALPGIKALSGMREFGGCKNGHPYSIYGVAASVEAARAAPLIPDAAAARASGGADKTEPAPVVARAPEVPRISSPAQVRAEPKQKHDPTRSVILQRAKEAADRARQGVAEPTSRLSFVRTPARPPAPNGAPTAKRGHSIIAVNAAAAALAAAARPTTDTNSEPPSAA